MVVVNAKKRLTLKKIKKHAWYNQETATRQEIFENFSYRKLVKDGQITMEEFISSNTITTGATTSHLDKLREKLGCEDIKLIDSARESTNDLLENIKDLPVKYTNYFITKDGDALMNEVVHFIQSHKFREKLCDEYYRGIFEVRKMCKITTIQVNILRKPKHDLRCVQ